MPRLLCTRASQVLKPHQLEGVRWLYAAAHGGGGLLADDPGLGKTLQVISTIEALVHDGTARTVLIVTPASLLANWAAEFRRWLGATEHRLKVTHLKPGDANVKMTSQLELLGQTVAPEHSIVLISYEGLRVHGGSLHVGSELDLLVADEAHCLAPEAAADARAYWRRYVTLLLAANDSTPEAARGPPPRATRGAPLGARDTLCSPRVGVTLASVFAYSACLEARTAPSRSGREFLNLVDTGSSPLASC